ncbi:hypothetical protein [Plantactinospora sonchi]|uniref:Uncharacterized protein n=1 Tax=Plantactinospora sonchi TaxID=1544735 RepID=A0ABU7RXE7_9ACTN
MRVSWRGLIGVGTALGAVVCWAIGLAVLQHTTEPTGAAGYAENNTYWVRDLRMMALLVVVLGLLLAVDGARAAVLPVGALGLLWLAADVVLDRTDLAGATAATGLALVGCAVVLAVVPLLARWRNPDGPRPEPRTLLVVSAIAAATAPLAARMESPTDTEPALAVGAVLLGVLLVVTGVAAARAAAPSTAARGGAARWLGAGLLTAAGVAGVVSIRAVGVSAELVPMLVLVAALIVGGSLLASERPTDRADLLRRTGALAVAVAGYPVLVMCLAILLIFSVPVGGWLTALAGSPPVNAADSDTLYALVGLLTGLALSGLVRIGAGGQPVRSLPSTRGRGTPSTATQMP